MTTCIGSEARGWLPAKVGCHWSRGDYSISTYSRGREWGYAVYHLSDEPQYFATWAEAEAAADRRKP